MTISRTAAITCWSRLQRASSATVPKLVFENRTQPATAIKRRLTLDQNSFQYDHGAFSGVLRYCSTRDLSHAMSKLAMSALFRADPNSPAYLTMAAASVATLINGLRRVLPS
jgi:hypothetical protein